MSRVFPLLLVAFVACGFEIPDAENKVIYGHDAKLAIEAYGFTDVRIVGPSFKSRPWPKPETAGEAVMASGGQP